MDAAVAVQLMLGLVEPQSSGIGGGGFLLYYDAASRGITVYDGRETAPAGATPTMLLRDGQPLPPFDAVASGLSVGVPGAVALLEMAHREHGKLPWADLFASSITVARKGFAVPPRLAAWLQLLKRFGEEPGARATYFNADGSPKKAGDWITNPALADTMQRIATEGTRAVVTWALEQHDVARVQACTFPWHTASQKVLERIGMHKIGVRETDMFGDLLLYERGRA